MFYLFLFYILMVPLEYIQEKIPKGPTGINYGNLSMILMVVMWLTYRGKKGKSPIPKTPINVVLLLYLAFHILGLVQTSLSMPEFTSVFDPGGMTFKMMLRFINGILMFFFAMALVDTRKKVNYVLVAMCLSMLLVFRAFRSDMAMHSYSSFSNELRASGPFMWLGSNELASMMAYLGVFMLLLAFSMRRLWMKGLMWLTSGCYLYGVLYSFSRGSQLSVVAALGLVASIRYKWVLLLMLVGFVTMDVWLPASVEQRWEMTEDEEGNLEASAQSRKRFWSLATDYYMRSPLIGHGIGSFILMNPEKMDTHSLYYRTLSEQGTVGIVLLLGVFGAALFVSGTLWRKSREPFYRQFGFAMATATVVVMIGNIFGDRFTYFPVIGHYFTLLGVAGRLYVDALGIEPMEDSNESEAGITESAGERKQPWRKELRTLHGKGSGRPGGLWVVAPMQRGTSARPAANRENKSVEAEKKAAEKKGEPPKLNIVGGDRRQGSGLQTSRVRGT